MGDYFRITLDSGLARGQGWKTAGGLDVSVSTATQPNHSWFLLSLKLEADQNRSEKPQNEPDLLYLHAVILMKSSVQSTLYRRWHLKHWPLIIKRGIKINFRAQLFNNSCRVHFYFIRPVEMEKERGGSTSWIFLLTPQTSALLSSFL